MKLRFSKKQSLYALLILVLVVTFYNYSGSRLLARTRWSERIASLVSFDSFLRNTNLGGKSDGFIGLIYAKFARQPKDGEWTFTSKCKCRKHERVKLVKSGNTAKFTVNSFGKQISNWKSIDLDNYRFNCDLYNAMRRGGNRRIISYALYGKHELYYRYFKNISLSVKRLYPEWAIRIYHDDTINKTKICELECLREFANDTGSFVDNLDFCDVNRLPLDLFDPSRTWSAGYLHAMKWRWLPVGDSLVDYFMSRDSDSLILEREVDAVNEWIESNTLLHVMRDNPQHTISVLGGLWGLAKRLDERLASQIYQKLLDSESKDTPLDHANHRGVDQAFLSKEIWPMFLKHKSVTVHDSFNCRSYGIISHGFPTKRKGNCFVGQIGECNLTGVFPSKCPLECRPPSHPDWEYC